MTETEGAIVGILGGVTLGGVLDYFGITHDGFMIMSIMLIVDWVFGITSALVLKEGVESEKAGRGLLNKITRWILPFIVAGSLKWTGMPIEWLLTSIIGIIVFSETYSIIGHIYSINTKEKLPELDAFKMLLGKLADFFRKLIDKNSEELDKQE